MEVVVSTTPRLLYPRERPGAHCTGGWVRLRAVLIGCGKSRPPTGIRSPDRPSRSESLYRLRYPGQCSLRRYRMKILESMHTDTRSLGIRTNIFFLSDTIAVFSLPCSSTLDFLPAVSHPQIGSDSHAYADID